MLEVILLLSLVSIFTNVVNLLWIRKINQLNQEGLETLSIDIPEKKINRPVRPFYKPKTDKVRTPRVNDDLAGWRAEQDV